MILLFCAIQEVKLKKPNTCGESKQLVEDSCSWSINGVSKTKYSYKYSDAKFERPIKTAYRITIHQSYRENGKVKKKQYYVSTIGYYDLVEFSIYDCILDRTLNNIAEKLVVETNTIWDLINAKFEPLEEKVIKEFQQTQEYKTKLKHDKILDDYRTAKHEFSEKYKCSQDEYDYCYNVFGKLMNNEYLNKIKKDYKASQEYQKRSYQNSSQSNYNYNSSNSSYLNQSLSNYTDSEKVYLKQFYKSLAKQFHPDVSSDKGQGMTLINKLKEQWNV